MKLYPDANILYGFFKETVKSWKERRQVVQPEIIKFLSKQRGLTIFASSLTKAEIARRLKLDYNLSPEDIERSWSALEKLLSIKMIERITIDSELVGIVKTCRFRSRINNVIHLLIAKSLHLTFLTGDKKIEEDGKKIYDNIIDYPSLRKKLS